MTQLSIKPSCLNAISISCFDLSIFYFLNEEKCSFLNFEILCYNKIYNTHLLLYSSQLSNLNVSYSVVLVILYVVDMRVSYSFTMFRLQKIYYTRKMFTYTFASQTFRAIKYGSIDFYKNNGRNQ